MKPARKGAGWARWRWRAAAAVAVVMLAGYAAHHAFSGIVLLPMFRVQRIVVRGTQRLSTGEVMALLDGLRGQSIFTTDLDEWRGAVLNSPWVAEALLRRTLPSTIEVVVRERVPLGVGRMNGSLYLVDDGGMVIDDYGPQYADLDLPIIDGLSSAHGEVSPDPARAALARRLLDELRVRNMAARVSQVDVSDARNAVVLLDADPTLVRLGDEHFVERLQSYLDLAPALRQRVSGMDYVDMRFDERVYVRPTANAPASRAPARKVPVAKTKGPAAKS